MGNDRGFTLIELLATLSLAAILLTLSVTALHNYWLVQSLDGAADEVATQMRRTQGQIVSESVPLIYGVGFAPSASGPTASSERVTVWKYHTNSTPTDLTDDVCSEARHIDLTNGTYVSSASFATSPLVSPSKCGGAASGSVCFFFARGTATATTASHIMIRQDAIPETETVKVIGLTGRVQRL